MRMIGDESIEHSYLESFPLALRDVCPSRAGFAPTLSRKGMPIGSPQAGGRQMRTRTTAKPTLRACTVAREGIRSMADSQSPNASCCQIVKRCAVWCCSTQD